MLNGKWDGQTWDHIPVSPGEPQPRIADGKYRGIRRADDGTYWGLPKVAPVPDTHVVRLQTALRNLLDSCAAGEGGVYPFAAPSESAVEAARKALL